MYLPGGTQREHKPTREELAEIFAGMLETEPPKWVPKPKGADALLLK